MRGFYVTNDRNYSYLGVRGFSRPGDYNARILLLIDGHRMNDNVFGSALLGTEFPLDIDLIDRIEIIRGPSSSLYGTSAFFAVINVITKRGERRSGASMSPAPGSFGSSRGRVSYGKGFASGAHVLLSGSAFERTASMSSTLRSSTRPRPTFGIAETSTATSPRTCSACFGRRFTLRRCTGRATRACRPRLSAPSSTTRDRGRSRPRGSSPFSTTARCSRWQLAPASATTATSTTATTFDHGDEEDRAPVVNKDFARGNWWGAEVKLRASGWRSAISWRWARSTATTSGRTSSTTTTIPTTSISTTNALDELGALRAGRDHAAREAALQPRPATRSLRHVRQHDQSAGRR